MPNLEHLPSDVVEDIAAIDRAYGLLYVFVYLHHAVDASFSEIKSYVDGRRWRDEGRCSAGGGVRIEAARAYRKAASQRMRSYVGIATCFCFRP